MCGPSEVSVVVEGNPDATIVVRLVGELDIEGAPKLREALLAIGAGDIVIDLSGLSFIDSTGLNVLVGADKQVVARGRRMTLRAPGRQVAGVLKISGLDRVFHIEAQADNTETVGQSSSADGPHTPTAAQVARDAATVARAGASRGTAAAGAVQVDVAVEDPRKMRGDVPDGRAHEPDGVTNF